MTSVTNELGAAMHKAHLTAETLAPLVGLTGETWSLRRKCHVQWELEKCFQILDILGIPRDQIYKYFVGGIIEKPSVKRKAWWTKG